MGGPGRGLEGSGRHWAESGEGWTGGRRWGTGTGEGGAGECPGDKLGAVVEVWEAGLGWPGCGDRKGPSPDQPGGGGRRRARCKLHCSRWG